MTRGEPRHDTAFSPTYELGLGPHHPCATKRTSRRPQVTADSRTLPSDNLLGTAGDLTGRLPEFAVLAVAD